MREPSRLAIIAVAPEINATLSKISQAGLPLAISRIAASVHDSRASEHM